MGRLGIAPVTTFEQAKSELESIIKRCNDGIAVLQAERVLKFLKLTENKWADLYALLRK